MILEILERFLVVIHVAAGITALIMAPIAMIVHKGGPAHRRWGNVYYGAMLTIFLSALALLVFRPNFFLLIISILSFYTAFTGKRVLRRKRPQRGEVAGWLDWTAAWIALVAGISFIGWGSLIVFGLLTASMPTAFAGLGIFFGLAIAQAAYSDLRSFKQTPVDKNWWWYYHMNRILSSYLAAVTAFAVQNIGRYLPAEWQWVVWAAPGLIGGYFIGRWINHYRVKFNRRAQMVSSSAVALRLETIE